MQNYMDYSLIYPYLAEICGFQDASNFKNGYDERIGFTDGH